MKKYVEEEFYELNEIYDRMPYDQQLIKKQNFVSETFAKNRLAISLLPIIANPMPLNYRHKVIVSATNIKTNGRFKIRLGLFKEGSKDIIPGVVNHIHDKDINSLLVNVEKILQKYKLEAYNSKYPKGIIKHVLVRKSFFNKTMMLVFVTQGHIFPNHKSIIKEITALHPMVKTVIQNIHNIDTPVVILDKSQVLWGPGYIEDKIEELTFRLSPNSFYQVNPAQMINLYQTALNFAKITQEEVVMDCYSGIGTISLLAGKLAKEVIAVESNKDAVKDSMFNKKANNIANVLFFNSDVEQFILNYEKEIDILIMDPARDGASVMFLESIKKLKPKRIIYISCFVETQVRDLMILRDLYEIVNVQPVDMFSYTSHIENIVSLKLRKK